MKALALGVAGLLLLFATGALLGWQAVMLLVCGFIFWLLMQFTRLMRVMGLAGKAPVGVASKVPALAGQIKVGMKLVDLLALTGSLGRKVPDAPSTYVWQDAEGARLEVVLAKSRVASTRLLEPESLATPQAPDGAA